MRRVSEAPFNPPHLLTSHKTKIFRQHTSGVGGYEADRFRSLRGMRVSYHCFSGPVKLYFANVLTGVVATHTDREMPKVTDSEGTNEDGEPDEPVKVLEKQATFGEYIVWGHETIPAADDTFVKGVEEWVKFAEAVCYSSLLALILKLTIWSDTY